MMPILGWAKSTGDRHATRGALKSEDLPYLKDLSEALLAQSTPGSSATLYLLLTVLVSGIVWASVATVDEVTRAEARVVPVSREQVISSLEGGILSELRVREGMVVEKGQDLVLLDPTRFKSQYLETASRILAIKGSVSRLRAEATGGELNFPAEVSANARIVKDERAAFEARRNALEESIASLKRSQALLLAEIASSERLAAQGLFSTVELSRLKRQANDLVLQIDERRNRFRADANSELLRYETELGQLQEGLSARLDSFQRTTLKSPIRGVVKNIRATTLGSSIPPSSPILEIVPLGEELLFEARIRPSEVAFISPGLPANIKLTTYDPAIYGFLKGTVESVSPDTFRDEARGMPQTEATYYRVIVRSPNSSLHARGRDWPVIPGMTAQVEIRTGEKTIMHYLIKPMFKAKDAFSER
ncbi:MAG: hypothetical protein RIR70_465 [Pseudomonadota bacterium]|jgi:adhesin transport system membrane fusion protein